MASPDDVPSSGSRKDANKSRRVMEAMMKMIKLDIKTLQQAYAGEPT